jgi:hypothetical protein
MILEMKSGLLRPSLFISHVYPLYVSKMRPLSVLSSLLELNKLIKDSASQAYLRLINEHIQVPLSVPCSGKLKLILRMCMYFRPDSYVIIASGNRSIAP